MSESTRIVVVTAGLSVPSSSQLLGERLAAALTERRPDLTLSSVLLREHATDLTNYLLTRVPSAALRGVLDDMTAADGAVVVTPVFNASYSGLFKLFFDALDEDTLAGKPVLLAATGGTPRHSLVVDQAMAPLFRYLKAIAVPTGVFAATADWGSTSTGLSGRIGRAAGELLDLLDRLPRRVPTDEFEDVVDFSKLLGR
ncbi:CE1759 family FMN reductase [Propionicicella superfundia]|uniref:CE1759 family FMN reductase n=1 Tax=Propionicicella superfundia TaxID=348582 RepID=UPI000428D962|nr:CE1759 family FMN reductase [Propionicicella superfundia]